MSLKQPIIKPAFEHFVPHSICPNCLNPITLSLPCQPVYSLDVAQEIIPITSAALNSILQRSKFPKRYIRDASRRRHRMLTAQEIRAIRSKYFIYNDPDGNRRPADPEGL